MTPTSQPSDPKTETVRLLTEIASGIADLRQTVRQLTEMVAPVAADHARLTDCLEKLEAALAAGAVAAGPESNHAAGVYCDFHADTILLSYDDAGNPAYKIKGQPFAKFGVRVWPETLPALGIDAAALKPGPNPISLAVRAVLNPETNKPRKVIGLAP